MILFYYIYIYVQLINWININSQNSKFFKKKSLLTYYINMYTLYINILSKHDFKYLYISYVILYYTYKHFMILQLFKL